MKRFLKAILTMLFITVMPLAAHAGEELYISSMEGSVPLRMQPNEKTHVILNIPACSQVELLETRNTWGKVVFRKKCGWINLSYTSKSYDESALSTGSDYVQNVIVDSGGRSLNLYSKPSSDENLGSIVKYTVPDDTVLNIIRKTKNGWALVSMNGKYAWIKTQNVKKYTDADTKENENFEIYYVYVSSNGSGAKIRSRMGAGEVLTIVPDCIKLTVRKQNGNYGYVSFDGKNGWINLKDTESSLSNAQMTAGMPVNREMTVSHGDTDVFELPTDYKGVGNTINGTIKKNATVFVQRQTKDGWSFVNSGGIKGWIAPEKLTEAQKTQIEEIKLCTPYKVFASESSKGLGVFDEPKEEAVRISYAPIGLEMEVIAEKNGYGYAVSDFSAGWIELSKTKSTYDDAIKSINKLGLELYRITDDTVYKKIPTNSEFAGNVELSSALKGEEIIVYGKVKNGDAKWGLTKYAGAYAWVDLSFAKEVISIWGKIGILLGIILLLALVVFLVLQRRKKHEQKL